MMHEHILQQPLWLQAWILWMVVINTASLVYRRLPEGRATLVAWVVNLVFMNALFYLNGYNRLLGLSHVLFWTPLVVYLWRRRDRWPGGRAGTWVLVLVITNVASLVIDYVDVVRYLLGDRT